jgi:hypothetical protein
MEVTPMTEMMSRMDDTGDTTPAAPMDGLDEQLITQLVDRARTGGLRLTGEGGVQQLTKRLLESALDGEITDHLGYDKHDPAGRGHRQLAQRHPTQDRAHRCRSGRDQRAARPGRQR